MIKELHGHRDHKKEQKVIGWSAPIWTQNHLFVCVHMCGQQTRHKPNQVLPKPSFMRLLAFSVYGILSTCSTYMYNLSWCNSDPDQQYSLRIARAIFLKSIGVTLYPEWTLVFNVLCTLTRKLRTTRLQS